jgi:predicted metal-binding membrane protein
VDADGTVAPVAEPADALVVTRPSRRLLLAVAVVLLVVGGTVLVWADAHARIEAVRSAIGEAVSQQAGSDYYRDLVDTPEFQRWVVVDAVINDATPNVTIVIEDDMVAIRAGAFGTSFFQSPTPRPWSPRFVTVPLAVGLVLGVALLLDAAAHYVARTRPRDRRDRFPRDDA